jgi:hypothetical protein
MSITLTRTSLTPAPRASDRRLDNERRDARWDITPEFVESADRSPQQLRAEAAYSNAGALLSMLTDIIRRR